MLFAIKLLWKTAYKIKSSLHRSKPAVSLSLLLRVFFKLFLATEIMLLLRGKLVL